MNYIGMNFEEILILMPIILTIGAFIFGILGLNNYFILISLGMFFCILVARLLKSLMPKKGIFLRPTDNECKCKFCPSECENIRGIGMPSEHALTLTFFAMMIYLHGKEIDGKVIFSFILALAVIFQRYLSSCHSAIQLIIGSFIGAILSVIYYFCIKSVI